MAKRRGDGEGSITHRENGRWRAQLSLPGGKRLSFTADTRRECQVWLRKTAQQQAEGLLAPDGDKITVEKYLLRWLEVSARPTLRPRVYERYEQLLRLHALPRLGRLKLSALRPDQLQQVYGETSAKGLAPRTARNLHMVLHRALRQATEWGLIPRNVADVVHPPKTQDKPLTVLTPEKVQTFFEVLQDDPSYALFQTALATGAREGELLALRWSDVDWDRKCIRIQRSLQYPKGGPVFVEPKTRAGRRVVTLPSSTLQVLRAHQKQQLELRSLVGSEWQDGDLVFCNVEGKPLTPGTVLRALWRALEKAGLPRIRFHDLRHTAASLMLLNGVHVKAVSERLGHGSINITLTTYAHLLPDSQVGAAETMDKLLGGRPK